jgi:transcriptional regulator with XRE-family HTH domain
MRRRPVNILRRLRREHLLTQQDLAAQAGLDRTTVIRLEQSGERASRETVYRLAMVLGVDPLEFGKELVST